MQRNILDTDAKTDPQLGLVKANANADSLVESVMQNPTLTTLNLSHHNLCRNTLTLLINALSEPSSSLVVLILVDCNINDDDMIQFARALITNRHLRRFCLADNQIGDTGITNLATALKTNQRLEALDCSENKFGFNGFSAIADMLSHNDSLNILGLSNNPRFNDSAAAVLATALAHQNRSLTAIDLDVETGVQTGINSVKFFADAMEKLNTGLVRVTLPRLTPWRNFLPEEKAVTALTRRNHAMTQNWRQVLLVIKFVNANKDNALKFSILPLVPFIMGHIQLVERTVKSKNPPFAVTTEPHPFYYAKIKKFTHTIFFNAEIAANKGISIEVVDDKAAEKPKIQGKTT